MGFYQEIIFPRLLDLSMSGESLGRYRRSALAGVSGEILEIGFGSGLNLAYYPEQVRKITVIDANAGMNQVAQKRIRASTLQVEFQVLRAEKLPMPDHTFDSVVSTWTLCSIRSVELALQEIHRVLKPQGQFFFLEHGLSPEIGIQRWQRRLNPIQQRLADGCQLTRNISELIETQHFRIREVNRFYAENVPKIVGYMTQGVATPQA